MPNRLIHQTSPYLLQHAHNPVDWYPWGEEALQKAREENKPILISIGYSACHWCHVMERESFENEATAALMNQHFVNIKIDREERPDLDHVYMDAVQTISGSGGWPLNVFLTPEGKPFFGGTYFPPVKAYNRSSWQDVLTAINSAWHEKQNAIIAQAENLTDHLQNATLFGSVVSTENQFSEEQLISISQNLMKTADTTWGGFGNAPKFPQTFSIQFLLRQYYHLQKKGSNKQEIANSELLSQALLSIDKMIMGGIYDHLGGGFARYSTDAQWLAPHFEKMLYDNALLISVISEAYQLTGKAIYKDTIEQTMNFIASEWQDKDGGFFSAYDADSEGEEGRFYTWEKGEVQALIPEPEYFQLFSGYYDISEAGNWEGTNILWVKQPLEVFCEENRHDLVKAEKILVECKARLLQARNKRIKPLLDDKKLMGWNALMITACCKAWAALANNKYLQMAEKAAGFIESCLSSSGSYHHNYKDQKAANPAFLDDLACYVQSLSHLQECTGKTEYLDKAQSITNLILDHFSDEKTPFFFYTPKDQTDIIIRKKEVYDSAIPSGNSTMALNLLYLGILLDDPSWRKRSEDMMAQMEKLTLKYPGSFGQWAQILQWHVYGLHEIAVVGEKSAELSAEVLQLFIPNKVMQQSLAGNDKYPLLARKQQEDNALIYVCKQFSCKKPVSKIEDVLSIIDS